MCARHSSIYTHCRFKGKHKPPCQIAYTLMENTVIGYLQCSMVGAEVQISTGFCGQTSEVHLSRLVLLETTFQNKLYKLKPHFYEKDENDEHSRHRQDYVIICRRSESREKMYFSACKEDANDSIWLDCRT